MTTASSHGFHTKITFCSINTPRVDRTSADSVAEFGVSSRYPMALHSNCRSWPCIASGQVGA